MAATDETGRGVGYPGGARGAALILALVAAATGATALVGWLLEVDQLVSRPGTVAAMMPATAVCALAGAMAAGLIALRRGPRLVPYLGLPILGAVLVAHLLPPAAATPADAAGAMSLATTAAALLVLARLTTEALRSRAAVRASVVLDTAGLGLVALPTLGYIFDARSLFENPVFGPMPPLTVASFLCIFLAFLLGRPERGWIAILFAAERGSEMARRVLPALILVAVGVCLLALRALRMDILTPDFRVTMLAYLMIVALIGTVVGFAHVTNLSERRAAATDAALRDSERARLDSEIATVQAQKVEMLGTLVGGVAHDFNNLLTVILGNLELLGIDDDPASQRSYIREATTASQHAAHLTRQLLAYGRKSRLDPISDVLDGHVDETIGMFRRVCGPNVRVVPRLGVPLTTVRLDVVNFQQALLNVLLNARDAMPFGGLVTVTTAVRALGGDPVEGIYATEALPDGDYVTVSITDTGHGMDPQTASSATKPFFTTKQVGEGSGLGLSMVSGFCRQSGGGLWIDSSPERGTTVTMAFPVTGAAAVTPRATPAARSVEPAAAEMLIVDDEVPVTRVMSRQLRQAGFRVRIAIDADTALAELAEGARPDVVITDLAMPGTLQGDDLARMIRARHPAIPVLLMSGYQSDGHRAKGPALTFLQKPIPRERLLDAIREALGQPRTAVPAGADGRATERD